MSHCPMRSDVLLFDQGKTRAPKIVGGMRWKDSREGFKFR